MNQRERRDAGLAYIADNAVFEEQKKMQTNSAKNFLLTALTFLESPK